MKGKNTRQNVYCDYAATTPLDPRVEAAMAPYWVTYFGNPSSLYRDGQEASRAVFMARRAIARVTGCIYRDVVFTGSATEANNLVLRGAVARAASSRRGKKGRVKILVSAVEHESVLQTARDLARAGVEVVEIPVSREGVVDVAYLSSALDARTVVVSVMYVNNEIGTAEPIEEIGALIKKFRARASLPGPYPIFHTDAAQAFQYFPCDIRALGVDMMTLSAHKMYGPKGVGALIAPRGAELLSPLITGGGQERGLRSGTENVPLIVGFAEAASLAERSRDRERKRVGALRDALLANITRAFPGARLNGPRKARAPNNLHMRFPNMQAQEMLVYLDLHGVSASAGPACASRSAEPSHVLRAIGLADRDARSSLRFSFGKFTKRSDIDTVFRTILKLKSE